MKWPALLLALLLLALTCSDASLLARGRTRTKKNRVTLETPYTCLDAPIDLPACRFNAEADEETREESSRIRDFSEPSAELDSNDESSVGDNQAKPKAMIIVYKIEGCIPSRLPFVLPICKQEDSVGRIVEVRRLFPFRVTGSSGYNSEATFVFPEADINQLHRLIHGSWSRPEDNEDNIYQDAKAIPEIPQPEETKITKRKKVVSNSIPNKKTMLKKLRNYDQYDSKEFDENGIFSKFPSAEKLQLGEDCSSDTVSHKTRGDLLNRINDSRRKDREINRQEVEKSSFAKYIDEFPYAKAIPYDREKLRVARIYSEFPHSYNAEKLQESTGRKFLYSRTFNYEPKSVRSNRKFNDEETNEDTNQHYEFPYAKAISYDPDKLRVARVGSEFPYNRAIPYDPVKFQYLQRRSEYANSPSFSYDSISNPLNNIVDEQYNYALPYEKDISYDSKDEVAKIGSEFPYTRAIPYDPVKLRIATVGSEFPYAEAIPYDPKKLEKRLSEIIDERTAPFYSRGLKGTRDETKEFDSHVVPFDSRMLDAAKEGRIFPYGKAVPDNTSKIRETMKVSRSREDRIKVPVRHVKTFFNEEIPTYARELQLEKNERRFEDSRDVQKNIINTGVGDYSNKRTNSGQSRVTRNALETNASSDNLEIPGRWSEFPYSKAIPFDPTKLRRPRSTMEELFNSLLVAPQVFPYSKAIPYDRSKLTAFRRKKSKSSDERMISEESEQYKRLE